MTTIALLTELIVERNEQIGDDRWHRLPVAAQNGFELNDLFHLPLFDGVLEEPKDRTAQSADDVTERRRWIVAEAELEWNEPVGAEVDRFQIRALRPVPEVQRLPVLLQRHVLGIEAFLEDVGRGPFAADHDVVPWLVPEVVVELDRCRTRLVVPPADDVELLIEQEKPTGILALGIAQARDHDLTRAETVRGVRSGEIVLLQLVALDRLVQHRLTLVHRIDDVDARRLEPAENEKPTLLVTIAVARRARVPTEVMQFIVQIRDVQPMDDLLVRARGRVDVDRGQVVRLILLAGNHGHVEKRFAATFVHRLERTGVARALSAARRRRHG